MLRLNMQWKLWSKSSKQIKATSTTCIKNLDKLNFNDSLFWGGFRQFSQLPWLFQNILCSSKEITRILEIITLFLTNVYSKYLKYSVVLYQIVMLFSCSLIWFDFYGTIRRYEMKCAMDFQSYKVSGTSFD